MNSLSLLEANLARELELIGYPPSPWVISDHSDVYDVAIIGGGMAGLAAAFALRRYGISNVMIFDANPQGKEGPWLKYARMKHLRSTKFIPGPAQNIASLTFHAWFEAQFGSVAWDKLYKIPTTMWMDYLKWYRAVLNLPVENNAAVISIQPEDLWFKLSIKKPVSQSEIYARKIVLATGREGFGGVVTPKFVKDLPRSLYAYTIEDIDFKELAGKRVGIVGAGASAFDAAAEALENLAASVAMFMRRPSIPCVNRVAALSYPGFVEGFYLLSDESRYQFFSEAMEGGPPPPFEALKRVAPFHNFSVWAGREINGAVVKGSEFELVTSRGIFDLDYLIIAAGYALDGSKQPELNMFYDKIQLWKHRPSFKRNGEFGEFPYLGSGFEFLEKKEGDAPYLKDLHCFNYAASLSHGFLSSDIPDISAGADRLAKNIAGHFFMQHWQEHCVSLEKCPLEFNNQDLDFLKNG